MSFTADGIDDQLRPFSVAMSVVERSALQGRVKRAMQARKKRGQYSHEEVHRPIFNARAVYAGTHARLLKVQEYRSKYQTEVRRLHQKGYSFRGISKRLRKENADGPSLFKVQQMMHDMEPVDPNADIDIVYSKQIKKTKRTLDKTVAKIHEQRYAKLGAYISSHPDSAIVTKGHEQTPKFTVGDIPKEERERGLAAFQRAQSSGAQTDNE